MKKFEILLMFIFSSFSQAGVILDLSVIDDIGNANSSYGTGTSSFKYSIGKYETTNSQYCEFLNSTDPSGTNVKELYNTNMSTNPNGGIDFFMSYPYGSKYQVKNGRDNNPVVFVSWWDAARMSNWMSNGQGTSSTENGTYPLTGLKSISSGGRNFFTSKYFIPTQGDWYKAAMYQPSLKGGDTDGYWQYPTASNSLPNTIAPSIIPNSANAYRDVYPLTQTNVFDSQQNYLTNVGAYVNSNSYYGTSDQLGNVWEWTESGLSQDVSFNNLTPYIMGWGSGSTDLILPSINPAFYNLYWGNIGFTQPKDTESAFLGFRLAANPALLPEPSLLSLVFLITFFQRRN